MRNDPKVHLDDLAEKFASGKARRTDRTARPEPRPAERKTAIFMAVFIGVMLVAFALGLIVLFVRR